MASDEIKRVERDVSARAPSPGGRYPAGVSKPEAIYLFKRFSWAMPVMTVFTLLIGVLSILVAFFLLVSPFGTAQAAAAFFAVNGVLILAFFIPYTWRWLSIRSRKPRWVIEEDRLVYVERDADELAEIPFEAVFNFDLVKCAGVWHVEIVLREPLDWTAFLSKRFFPVVRRIPGREWALLVLTARESPPVILEMLRTRLKAYRARGELE